MQLVIFKNDKKNIQELLCDHHSYFNFPYILLQLLL